MTLFDYFVIAIIGVSMLLGLMRGAIKEVFSLASWILAFIVAKAYSVELSRWLETVVSNPSLRLLTAFIILFVATLIILGVISLMLTALIKKIGLGSVDRVLGTSIGFVRGVVIMLVLVILGGMTALPQQNDWRNALTSGWFETLASSVKPWLPHAMAKRINFGPPKEPLIKSIAARVGSRRGRSRGVGAKPRVVPLASGATTLAAPSRPNPHGLGFAGRQALLRLAYVDQPPGKRQRDREGLNQRFPKA